MNHKQLQPLVLWDLQDFDFETSRLFFGLLSTMNFFIPKCMTFRCVKKVVANPLKEPILRFSSMYFVLDSIRNMEFVFPIVPMLGVNL